MMIWPPEWLKYPSHWYMQLWKVTGKAVRCEATLVNYYYCYLLYRPIDYTWLNLISLTVRSNLNSVKVPPDTGILVLLYGPDMICHHLNNRRLDEEDKNIFNCSSFVLLLEMNFDFSSIYPKDIRNGSPRGEFESCNY